MPPRTLSTSQSLLLRRLRPSPTTPQQHRSISAYGYEQAKALTFPRYGEPSSVLTLHKHSISPPHSNLLTLRFLASPINPADINQIQGVYPSRPHFSTALSSPEALAVGGNEGVAEVLAVGSGVAGFKKGDWVIQRAPGFGTWRTHAQSTGENLVVVGERERDGLSPQQVGTVSVNPCTAWQMLRGFGGMREGDWFVQNGANSGVGRAAIQLGREWGFRSLNVVRKREEGMEELREELKGLGADVVVTDEEVRERGFGARVKEWTNGGREEVKLGLNCVGGELVNAMAKVLSPGARLVTYGAMSKQPVSLPAGLLIFKNVGFDGFWVSKWSEQNPKAKEGAVREVLELTRQGKFRDTPMDEVRWDWDTKQEPLVKAVQGTLEGFRSGKGIFVFGET